MEDLTKQQLILLGLLVSFVTSLATGIVTVSLMNQYPESTRTVSQVIEKTIQQIAAPQDAAVVESQDTPSSALAAFSPSLVRFVQADATTTVNGIGVVLTDTGVVLTDKASIGGAPGILAKMEDGELIPYSVIRSQDNGDIVFLAPSAAAQHAYSPASLAPDPSLGQPVLSLSGTSTMSLSEGYIASSDLSMVRTSIAVDEVIPGSPLFDMKGRLIGVRLSSVENAHGAAFYPISNLQSVIPK